MVRHRSHSIEFKRQVVQDYLAGETLHSLARRHDLSRNLIRIWIQKFEGGAFDDEAFAVDTIEAYEARIAALERLVGRQALELECPSSDDLRRFSFLRNGGSGSSGFEAMRPAAGAASVFSGWSGA